MFNNNYIHTTFGPDARKSFLNRVVEEYDKGRIDCSVFFQVVSLFGSLQERYLHMKDVTTRKVESGTAFLDIIVNNTSKIDNKSNNKLNEHIAESLKAIKNSSNDKDKNLYLNIDAWNFMHNISDPSEGFKKITELCNNFPSEWTVLQIVKGPRPQTTYSDFNSIHERDSDIYFTLLRHARSSDYPEPICIKFSDSAQVELFENFHKLRNKFKENMQYNSNGFFDHDNKLKYWENLKKMDKEIRETIVKFQQYIFPWIFLFRGIPTMETITGSQTYQNKVFREVDKLCDSFNIKQSERVLLSLVALQILDLNHMEIESICQTLSMPTKAQAAAQQLLKRFQVDLNTQSPSITQNSKNSSYILTNYPCILIVDEQLDHFFWEELNVSQEMSRVNSLHCLWNLYNTHKDRIKKGYLQVSINTGACVVNPNKDLKNSEARLGEFFKYWKPNWLLKLADKPSEEELFEKYLKQDCYIYAGHGSGLQFINGKHISKQKIDSIVFLFGCDSTCMNSFGLYSDLIGAHIFYQAASCPTMVGCLLPALDSYMDVISVEIISRWVMADKKDTLSWDQIDHTIWQKKAKIEPTAGAKDKSSSQSYHIASLCGILTKIHARNSDSYCFNTVIYVCRGLPVWNCNIKSLPK